eukprot:GHVL01009105.1.p1 GENE.GHVL01009105.1~~GHVL01009105.1.p1  ORF type:complete len:293 (-),score=31.13 GHVL01009105.1:86-964(-)
MTVPRAFFTSFSRGLMTTKTAACLVIGDEVLRGSVHDTNSHTAAKILFSCGVRVDSIHVIKDDIPTISDWVKKLSNSCNYVITSGGIGPTHDDLTYEAIANAFDTELELHAPTAALMESYLAAKDPSSVPLNEARLRMARLPKGCRIINTEGLWVPTVVMNNVYVLPGIPHLFEKMLRSAAMSEFGGCSQYYTKFLYTDFPEGQIAQGLKQISNEHKNILIGSYPRLLTSEKGKFVAKDGKAYLVDTYYQCISLQGKNESDVECAAAKVSQCLDGAKIHDIDIRESAMKSSI